MTNILEKTDYVGKLLNTNTSLNDVTYLYKNKYIESNNMSLELNYTNIIYMMI